MKLAAYSLITVFLPTFAYAIFWLQFRPNLTSQVHWLVVLILGVVLAEILTYFLVIKTHDIKKLGIAGQEQKPEH